MSRFDFEDIEREIENCQNVLKSKSNLGTRQKLGFGNPYEQKRRKYQNKKVQKIIKKHRSKSVQKARPASTKQKIRKTRKEVIEENNRNPKYNFRPKIKRSKVRTSRSQRQKNLYAQNTKQKILQRQKLKKHLQEERLRVECTFQPGKRSNNFTSNSSSNSVSTKVKRRSSTSSLFNYLHHTHDNRAEELECLKNQKELDDLSKYSFKPMIYVNVKPLENPHIVPLHERIGSIQRERVDRKRTLQEEYFNKYKYEPRIDLKSKRIANALKCSNERMKIAKFKKKEKIKKYLEGKESECTYKPKINQKSNVIVARKFSNEGKSFTQSEKKIQNFYARPYLEKLKKQQKLNSLKYKDMKVLPKKKVNYDYMNKLCIEEQHKRHKNKKVLKKKLIPKYSFQPNLCIKSKLIGKESNVNELYQDKKRKIKKAMRKRKNMVREKKLYTFKPKVSDCKDVNYENKYRLFNKNDYLNEKEYFIRVGKVLKKAQRKKEAFIINEKRKREKEFRKNYKFKPTINKNKDLSSILGKKDDHGDGGNSDNRVLNTVNGLEAFLNKFKLAKAMKEDKKRREIEAFQVKGVKRKKNMKFTVPKPFDLHFEKSVVADVRRLAKLKDQKIDTSTVNISSYYL